MKTCTLIVLICGGCFALGFVFAAKKSTAAHSVPTVPTAVAGVEQAVEPPANAAPEVSPPATVRSATATAVPAMEEQPGRATAAASQNNPIPNQVNPQVARAIKAFTSANASFQEKDAAWKQIMGASQLDQTIDALKQGIAENPDSAPYKAALGQAELKKAAVLGKSGASVNQMGILGMQADQNFEEALKLDPSNWDAQFYKAIAMSYWPAELNKGPEVVQRLAALIDQQETQTPKPEFALTYAALGDQYLKTGQKDFAYQTWRMGLQKFPSDATLLKKTQQH